MCIRDRRCSVCKNSKFVKEYCCFNGEAFLRFSFIQHGRHAFSYMLVQVTVNAPLVRVELLRAVNRNPDLYSYLYSYSCLCERSLTLVHGIRTYYECMPFKEAQKITELYSKLTVWFLIRHDLCNGCNT